MKKCFAWRHLDLMDSDSCDDDNCNNNQRCIHIKRYIRKSKESGYTLNYVIDVYIALQLSPSQLSTSMSNVCLHKNVIYYIIHYHILNCNSFLCFSCFLRFSGVKLHIAVLDKTCFSEYFIEYKGKYSREHKADKRKTYPVKRGDLSGISVLG